MEGFADDDDGVPATELLPVEMWQVILDNVECMDDLLNCYRTCKLWETILLLRVKPTILLHKVIPIFVDYLGGGRGGWGRRAYAELVKCRLVCRRWKEIIDSTFIQKDWDWELNYRLDAKDYLRQDNLTLQGTKLSSSTAASFLVDVAEERGNPFPSRTLQYVSRESGIPVSHLDHNNDLMRDDNSRHTRQVRNLIYQIRGLGGETGTVEAFKSHFLLEFPNLVRLKLILGPPEQESLLPAAVVRSKDHQSSWDYPLETDMFPGLERENKTGPPAPHTKLLQLTIYNSLYQVMPLPHLCSSLILRSPHLQKVTLVWSWSQRVLEHQPDQRSNVATLLSAISERSVPELVLIGWEETFSLHEYLPPPDASSWPLKFLTVRFTVAIVGVTVPNCFRRVLQSFGWSLEELRIQIPMNTCQGHGLFAVDERVWWGCCACKAHFKIPQSLKFSKFCYLSHRFHKLRLLATPDTLLHPDIFGEVMRTCPALEQLWIYHSLDQKWWGGGAGGPGMENVVRGFVSHWRHSFPPTLHRIGIQSCETDHKWSYNRFSSRSKKFQSHNRARANTNNNYCSVL